MLISLQCYEIFPCLSCSKQPKGPGCKASNRCILRTQVRQEVLFYVSLQEHVRFSFCKPDNSPQESSLQHFMLQIVPILEQFFAVLTHI